MLLLVDDCLLCPSEAFWANSNLHAFKINSFLSLSQLIEPISRTQAQALNSISTYLIQAKVFQDKRKSILLEINSRKRGKFSVHLINPFCISPVSPNLFLCFPIDYLRIVLTNFSIPILKTLSGINMSTVSQSLIPCCRDCLLRSLIDSRSI